MIDLYGYMHDFFVYPQAGLDVFRGKACIMSYNHKCCGIGSFSNPPHMQISQPGTPF